MMLNKNRLYELSKNELEKENLILSIQSYKKNSNISLITLIISLSSLIVSISSLIISYKSENWSRKIYEYSLQEELYLDENRFNDKTMYIKFLKNENNEYIISNEFYVKIINKSHHSSSIASLQRIEVHDKNKDYKTIIRDMDGNELSDDNGNLRESIKLKAEENINLKIEVKYTIKSKDIKELIDDKDLIDKEISKNNHDSSISKIITKIYGEDGLTSVSVNTSKYQGVIIGFIDLLNLQ